MTARPPVFTWNEELHFGPPSEPIDIQTFVNQAEGLHNRGLCPWPEPGFEKNIRGNAFKSIAGWKAWKELPEDIKASIQQDCELDDLSSPLAETLSSQKRMHYLQTLHADATLQCGISQRKGRGKGKQNASYDDPDLMKFRDLVEHTSLKSWRLKPAAKPYARNNHVPDLNALDNLKSQPLDPLARAVCYEVIITLTIYTRNTWYPYEFSRDSQHALISSNTLADLWSCIPCALKSDGSLPKEVTEPSDHHGSGQLIGTRNERVVGFETGDAGSDQDRVVMVIENVAYCNDHGPQDYTDKLLLHTERFKAVSNAPPPLPPGPYERIRDTTPLAKGLSLDDVQLRTLTLRINEPYWMLHRGSCEHWFVVDEIRLQNSRDPTSGYPIGLQRTPVYRHLCRICSKVPASLSVLNDVRLGESPCLVCQACWALFGGPPQAKEDDDLANPVLVVPIAPET